MDPVTPPPCPSQWETLSFNTGDGATRRTTSTLGRSMSHNRREKQKHIEASQPPRSFVRRPLGTNAHKAPQYHFLCLDRQEIYHPIHQ